jgi:hypothetical protein
VAFKKHLTRPPFGGRRAQVIKQRGKGSTQQDDTNGGETVTGGAPLDRMLNRYPKPAPPSPMPVAPAGDQAEYDQSE